MSPRQRLRSSESGDFGLCFFLVLTNIMMKMGFLKILKHLGLTELMRPTVSKIVTRNNIEFTTASPTLTRILFDYVWKFDVRESDVFIATYPKAGKSPKGQTPISIREIVGNGVTSKHRSDVYCVLYQDSGLLGLWDIVYG